MRVVWKYTLGPTYKQTIDVPTGFKVRHVGPPSPTAVTSMGLCVWIEVDTEAKRVPVDFYIGGTGQPVPGDGATYCGTAVMADQFVWHVYVGVPS